MNIIFLDKPAHPFFADKLGELGHEITHATDWSRARILAEISDFDALMVRSGVRIDQELLLAGQPKLKTVARWGVGLEHIDLEAAEKLGISVHNSPEGSMHAVAEHTVGMILMLMNHLGRAERQLRQGEWLRRPNTGVELRGKTVGLIGYGNMGKQTAKRLVGFGCEVIAHDKFLSDYGDNYAKAVSLAELQARAQVVSLHIYAEGNYHYANQEWFESFKYPIWFINTARGIVCDTASLIGAIESGRVIGAALDVHEHESMSFTEVDMDKLPESFRYLVQSNQVVLTPHIAGWSEEAEEGHARVLIQKMFV